MEENKTTAVQQTKKGEVSYMVGDFEVNLTKETVINYLVSGNGKVTEQEVVMFIALCKANNLNPFNKDCYLVKFGTSPAQMVISSEALLKRAHRNPHFKGIKYGVIIQRGDVLEYQAGAFYLESDKIVGGWATVLRDDQEPLEVTVALHEYKKDQATWKTQAGNMISKCARAKALREAFPEIAGGMISEEEKSNDPNYNPFQSTTEESASKLSPRAQRLRNIMNNPGEAEKVQTIVAQGEVKEQKVEQEDVLPFDE